MDPFGKNRRITVKPLNHINLSANALKFRQNRRLWQRFMKHKGGMPKPDVAGIHVNRI
ncbi:MAG: hypothetical protein ACLUPK_06180 [Veillonella sp.]